MTPVKSAGTMVPASSGVDDGTMVEQRLNAVTLGTSSVEASSDEFIQELRGISQRGNEILQSELVAFQERSRAAQSMSMAMYQERFAALGESRARGRETWKEMMAADKMMTAVHADQPSDTERFSADVQAFSRMQKELIEIKNICFDVVAEKWLDIRMNQLKAVETAIDLVLTDRKDRRESAQQAYDIEMNRSNQSHKQGLETKVQAHTETVELKNMSQNRQEQQRADNLADKKVDLEEKLEKFRHDLEMRKEEINKPVFWTSLLKVFRWV